jgi:hypothetical protein
LRLVIVFSSPNVCASSLVVPTICPHSPPPSPGPQATDTQQQHKRVGTLKSNRNRSVVLPAFVIDAMAETSKGKGREDLLWELESESLALRRERSSGQES